MAQEVFKRYEKKYILTRSQFQRLMAYFSGRMTMDHYGKHKICNIYYDTLDYELIRTSLEKPEYKEKVRLRSYGIPSGGDTVFLELKKKFGGVVYKRRAAMNLNEAEDYLKEHCKPRQDSQILRELDYTIRRYHLIPAVYLSYDRTAYYGNENSELRVTFDTDITGRSYALDLERGSFGVNVLDQDLVLMEVKIPEAMPVWMGALFSELGIFPVSFSKYGTYYKNYILKHRNETGGSVCA
ncbi:VTC domain-containing protein [Clostridium sp. MCC353]|uniref:polyphosphate polymerase domain-containing protein n=1 Tax=Clostridium sp. MCC353 TaxID=2592646 RepID=UPI001C0203F4|nr:polyphosphate polymerase domain-containing protein [Clostridium sp. MCC353]MBT9779525.1 VTC domain-containing protein [Clostridium sp. MCC353]